ncbi:hypothetical protein AB0J80_03855 [Actinoplanes sp. NPDC049548]|uniref:hypothetical protein n=1 Tax=Actinoplanes sp. NPDC049548 TaxID=3155152 RepID=UPI0034147903
MESAALADLGRTALELSYPEEADEFDAAWDRHHGGGRHRPRPPVGIGVDLLPLADHLVTALTFLSGAAATRVTERATDALTDRTKSRLAALISRADIAPPRPAPLDAAQEREVFDLLVGRLRDVLSPEEAERIAEGVIGALRLRSGGER